MEDLILIFFDIASLRRLIKCMIIVVPSDALRIARSLAALSQRQVAEAAQMDRMQIVAAEGQQGRARVQSYEKLRAFYEDLGIEFLGTVDVRTGTISGAGARWRKPSSSSQMDEPTRIHAEPNGVSFVAARSLLNVSLAKLAHDSGIERRQLSALENHSDFSKVEFDRLRAYYESVGIEFLGQGDVSKNLFYGVGVRWKPTIEDRDD
ncbi:XRE family transcriptional regulator [Sinorhizobium meliloti]|nr:XRE family transcriptional regulator [Sinorhizobium meliloti]MDX0584576.1 XRE family transcriptional regulator [Sinorhizobium medicae]